MTRISITKSMKTVSARLSEEDLRLLEELCSYYNLTTSEAIRILVKTFIEHNQNKLMDRQDLESTRFYEEIRQSNKVRLRNKKHPH